MKRLILPLAILPVVALVLACWFFALPRYKVHKEVRCLKRASSSLARGDLANASLSARQALQLNPRSLAACEIIAQVAERSRSPAALDWRVRAVELDPTPVNKLRSVACALRFERPPFALARRMLREVEPILNDLPAFHVLSAELALKLAHLDDAANHFETAASLEPANRLHVINLAVLRLQSTNTSVARRARASLEQLSSCGDVGVFALRWLVAEDLRQNSLENAEAESRRLIAHAKAQLDDHLQHLTVLQRVCDYSKASGAVNPQESAISPSRESSPSSSFDLLAASKRREFWAELDSLQARAQTNAVELFNVCEWMGQHGLAENALKWLAQLDPKQTNVPPLALAQANLYLALADWPALQTFLENKQWDELDFLRQALLSRASFGQNHHEVGQALWAAAVRSAGDQLGALNLLLSLADDWQHDSSKVLWQIAHRFPREQWALQELERRYYQTQDTRGLNMVYGARLDWQSNSNDLTNQNNYATTSMLLGLNMPRAHNLARDLYRKHPSDPVVASTYAYSLYMQGHALEGLNALKRFKPEVFRTPGLALYYALLLTGVGDAESAKPYFAFAEKAQLLPEERQLLRRAREGKGADRASAAGNK